MTALGFRLHKRASRLFCVDISITASMSYVYLSCYTYTFVTVLECAFSVSVLSSVTKLLCLVSLLISVAQWQG